MSRWWANARWGGGWGLRVGAAVYLVELVALSVDGWRAGIAALGCAYLLAAFVCGLLGLGLAAVLGLAAAYAAGDAAAEALLEERWQRLRTHLGTADETARRRFAARLVATTLLIVAAWLGALAPAWEAVSRIQTPLYGAVAALGAAAAAALGSLILWPVWIRTGELVARLRRRPPAPWLALALLGAAVVAGGAVVVALTWASLASYVPWRAPLVVAGAALVAVGWAARRRRVTPRPARRLIVRLLAAGLFVAGAVTAVFLPRTLAPAADLVASATGPLGATHGGLTALLDFDGDGALSWLGGGDCAPFDQTVYPGAWDEPGDGVDQNCDGHDSNLVAGAGPGRHDYPADPAPGPLPVIFITIDAVSALHMELHGAKRRTMPNLTRRAATGAVFNWAFSEGPATRLSFPSLLTGRHNSQIARQLSRRTTVPWVGIEHTLGTVFARAGYRTESVMPDRYFARTIRWLNQGFARIDDSAASAGAGEVKNGERVTAAALARLDALADQDRFLLWVHYTDAHYPHRLPREIAPTFGRRPTDIYDRELQLVDQALEPLLAGIEERLGGRDHVVAITADHGQAFDAKHAKYHQDHDISTAVTQVPLIFWSPFSGGLRTDRVASIIDVVPTLLNMVGLAAPGIAGDSLLPTIQGAPDVGRPIMQQFYLPENRSRGKDPLVRVAIRKHQYVLHQLRAGDREQLYDYRADPLETRDLIDELPAIAAELRDIRDSKLSWTYEDWNRTAAAPAGAQ